MTGRAVALVTGGSSGIGLSLARVLAECDHDLVVAAEDDAVHDVPARLTGTGAEVVPVQVDLSLTAGVNALHERLVALGRPVAVAALNAGITVGGPFRDTDLDDDLRLVNLNCRSVVHLAKLLVRDMLAADGGRLLLTSSTAAAVPGPYIATYSASKAFIRSFGSAIRHELEDTTVSVTTLLPGPTDTEIFERGDLQDTRLARGSKADPDEVARTAYDALMAGDAEVVAGTPTDKASMVAGAVLPQQVSAATAAVETRPRSDNYLG